ncbi:hypothetical protein AAFF_G00426700 [Aldrovandia affinis]|uniref:Uncharacterized protein n=1 Tax=Aldrovandia affinis TaxID=143900 RepID=A0AAD7WIZ5_9TELE|nr:hypothetical protein AAFF_G00426700 [Aldrovandia affinis]
MKRKTKPQPTHESSVLLRRLIRSVDCCGKRTRSAWFAKRGISLKKVPEGQATWHSPRRRRKTLERVPAHSALRKLRKTEKEEEGLPFQRQLQSALPFPASSAASSPSSPSSPSCLSPIPVSQDAAHATILGEGWHEMEVRTRAGASCH